MPVLYTIGHSTRPLEVFLTLLHTYEITHLVDIRTVPKSRHVRQFNKDELSAALQKENVTYIYLPELGGLRHPHKESINYGWHNSSFRGFADYMQTAEFYQGLKRLNLLLKKPAKVAIMCSEAVPWRCHRSLIADAEIIRGIHVLHITSKKHVSPHTLTSFAVVDRTKKPIRVFYPKAV